MIHETTIKRIQELVPDVMKKEEREAQRIKEEIDFLYKYGRKCTLCERPSSVSPANGGCYC